MAKDGRQQRGEATRGEILGVARRLFADFGYHNTGISDIQAATGLTKGAFYHHFRAKEELALAVLEAAWDDYVRLVIEPAKERDAPGQRLSTLLDCIVALNGRPEWQNCRLLATLSAEATTADGAIAETVQDMQEKLLSVLMDMVADAQQAGQATQGPPEALAQVLLGSIMGMVLMRKVGVRRTDLATAVEWLRAVLLVVE